MKAAQNNLVDTGKLQISVTSSIGAAPIPNASIEISYTGDPNSVIEKVETDSNGQTELITLDTPPLEYSMAPSENQPYSEYTFQISAPDFEPLTIAGAELMSGVTALQDARLSPILAQSNPVDVLTIGPHTLFGD